MFDLEFYNRVIGFMNILTEAKQKPVYSMIERLHLPQHKSDKVVMDYAEKHKTTFANPLFNLYMRMYLKYFDFVLVKDR